MSLPSQTLSKAADGAAEVTKVKESGQADLLGVMVGDRLIGKIERERGRGREGDRDEGKGIVMEGPREREEMLRGKGREGRD